jgi:glycerophosphoryl diester phosphodiesterase
MRFARAPGALPFVLGHRGARHAAPENTLRAFELARTEGADGVELDVRLDGDGRIVVLHDATLSRVSSGESSAHAEALSTSALQSLDIGDGERVPLLDDVLDWAKRQDQRINIEVKSDVRNRRGLIEALVGRLALEPEGPERLLLSSFDPRFVFSLAHQLPDLPVCWLVHAQQRLLRRAPGYRLLGAVGVNPQHTLLSANNVERLKADGALVNTWTVNAPELAVAYALFGVDSIISDCPGKIRVALDANGQRSHS